MDTYSSAEACGLADISYRQLDYWTRSGYVAPMGSATPGSGARRRWSAQQVAVLSVLARVSGQVPISRLAQLAAVLHDLQLQQWTDTVLLIDGNGGVWLPDAPDGAPAVATAVHVGRLLPEQLRHPALRTSVA